MSKAACRRWRSTLTADDNDDRVEDYTYNDSGIRVSKTVSIDANDDGDFTDPGDTNGEKTEYLIDANNPTGYAQVLEETNTTTMTSPPTPSAATSSPRVIRPTVFYSSSTTGMEVHADWSTRSASPFPIKSTATTPTGTAWTIPSPPPPYSTAARRRT